MHGPPMLCLFESTTTRDNTLLCFHHQRVRQPSSLAISAHDMWCSIQDLGLPTAWFGPEGLHMRHPPTLTEAVDPTGLTGVDKALSRPVKIEGTASEIRPQRPAHPAGLRSLACGRVRASRRI